MVLDIVHTLLHYYTCIYPSSCTVILNRIATVACEHKLVTASKASVLISLLDVD